MEHRQFDATQGSQGSSSNNRSFGILRRRDNTAETGEDQITPQASGEAHIELTRRRMTRFSNNPIGGSSSDNTAAQGSQELPVAREGWIHRQITGSLQRFVRREDNPPPPPIYDEDPDRARQLNQAFQRLMIDGSRVAVEEISYATHEALSRIDNILGTNREIRGQRLSAINSSERELSDLRDERLNAYNDVLYINRRSERQNYDRIHRRIQQIRQDLERIIPPRYILPAPPPRDEYANEQDPFSPAHAGGQVVGGEGFLDPEAIEHDVAGLTRMRMEAEHRERLAQRQREAMQQQEAAQQEETRQASGGGSGEPGQTRSSGFWDIVRSNRRRGRERGERS